MKPELSNVQGYTDLQLINRVKSLPSFKKIPRDYWVLGVQSQEDEFNVFDDKFYLFKGHKFILVTNGTTNAGLSGLKGYAKYNKKGCAVIKTDQWYYDLWKFGYHKGRMAALKQRKPILYYRDWNKNQKAEQIGKVYEGIIGINFHTVTYGAVQGFWRRLIGGWSVGCQVANIVRTYYKILQLTKDQKTVSYCLIDEF